MAFEKVPSRRKSELVVEQILGELFAGNYEVGDLLPPEAALAEQMGVSRTSCREAMAVLRVSGIIETRQGNGSIVRAMPDSADGIHKFVDILRREPFDPLEVLSVREMVEPAVIGLAAESVTAAQVSEMEAEIREMRDASNSQDSEGCILHNSRFHFMTISATNNDVLISILQPLYYGITKATEGQGQWRKMLLEKCHCLTGRCVSCLNTHTDILLALKQHNAKEARDKLTRHFEEMRREFTSCN